MKDEWDTEEVRAARAALLNGPHMGVAELNLSEAKHYGHGRAKERRIDDALADIARIHRELADLTEALVVARRTARGEIR